MLPPQLALLRSVCCWADLIPGSPRVTRGLTSCCPPTLHTPAHLVEWDVLAHQTTQAVDEGGQRDGPRCIQIAKYLRPGAAEVKHCAALPAKVGGEVSAARHRLRCPGPSLTPYTTA